MEDINCLQCSNGIQRTRKISIFDKELQVKNYVCSADGKCYKEKGDDLKLQVTICPTTYCGGNCAFCSAENTKEHNTIDLKKLEQVLFKLKDENIVRGISISGGEPFTDVVRLNEIINMVFDILGNETEVSINTNGSGLKHLHQIQYLSYIDAIHISRHHYEDGINQQIFHLKVPTEMELKEIVDSISYKDIFVFNCLLLKDYIDSKEEMHKFLEFAMRTGVPKVGFVTPMPVNEFARQHRVNYKSVIRREDERLLFTRGFQDFDFCQCQDGVYVAEDGAIIEFYGRETTFGPGDYVRGLVFGADNHLRAGYGGEIIL